MLQQNIQFVTICRSIGKECRSPTVTLIPHLHSLLKKLHYTFDVNSSIHHSTFLAKRWLCLIELTNRFVAFHQNLNNVRGEISTLKTLFVLLGSRTSGRHILNLVFRTTSEISVLFCFLEVSKLRIDLL